MPEHIPRIPKIEFLSQQKVFSAQAQRHYVPVDLKEASSFLALSNLSFPSLTYQFVNANTFNVILEKVGSNNLVKSVDTVFYSKDVDTDVRHSFHTELMADVKYRVPPQVTENEVWRYLGQLANFLAKYVAIDSGRVVGGQFSHAQYDLADAARNFWCDDWYYRPNEPWSADLVDSTAVLQTCRLYLKEYTLPPVLQQDIIKLFTPRKLSAAPWSPFVGFVPQRRPSIRTVVDGGTDAPFNALYKIPDITPFQQLPSQEVLWIKEGIGNGNDALPLAPPSARSLEREINVFRANPVNIEIHRLLQSVFSESWNIQVPDAYNYTADADFLALWSNGGVLHEGDERGFVYPDSGDDEGSIRFRVPLWASTKIGETFLKYWTHGYGKSADEIAGTFLCNHDGALIGGKTIQKSARLPLYIYAHDKVTERPVRNYIKQTVKVSEDSVIGAPAFDEMEYGWRRAYRVASATGKDVNEVGMVPVTHMKGRLQWADVTLLRQEAWIQWRKVFGVASD